MTVLVKLIISLTYALFMVRPQSRVPVDAHDLIVWTLNETSATWHNSGSGGALDLQVRTDAVTAPVPDSIPSPAHEASVAFAGGAAPAGDYISTSPSGGGTTTIGEATTAFTVSAYVYLLDYHSGWYNVIVVKNGDLTGTGLGFQLQFNNTNDGAWYLGINIGGTWQFVGYDSGVHVPLNKWTHVGATYDGSNVRTYQNGVLTKTVACAPCGAIDYQNHGAYDVGGGLNSSFNNLHGWISDVRISNVARALAYFQAAAP
jgi:hypothetical protein